MNIDIDTQMLEDTSRKIIEYMNDFDLQINNYFKKLNQIPITGEWTGNNAEEYARVVLLDKEMYLKYSEGIKKIAREMQNLSSKLDNDVIINEEKDKDK